MSTDSREFDRITALTLSSVTLPLASPVSDAKVFTGRQRPMNTVELLFAEISTAQGHHGIGFSYSKRAGGRGQFAHAQDVGGEIVGDDPSDIERLYSRMLWAGASVGRSGTATQAIAAIDIALWDLKARRADLPLSKLLGSHRDAVRCYNTSGGFLHLNTEEIVDAARSSLAAGIGGIKMKVGLPDTHEDLRRVEVVRAELGDAIPFMVDANQQWDRRTALRMGRALEQFDLEWIEEPLDAYDAEGHADLAARLDTPIATGEMLTSVAEHEALIEARAADVIQPDAARIGGITPFLKLAGQASRRALTLAPHFAMQIHVHLAAAYPAEPWVEHFEWLDPLFEERLLIEDGRIVVPRAPGLGLSLTEQARVWTTESHTLSM